MSQAESFVDTTQNLSKMLVDNLQNRKMIGEQTERLWRAEEEMIGSVEDYFAGWCERRRDAAQAGVEFGNLLANGADQSAVMEAWRALSSDAMKRFSEDAKAQFGLFQKFAASFTPVSVSVGGDIVSAEPAEKKAASTKASEAEGSDKAVVSQ